MRTETSDPGGDGTASQPLLRIVRGDATAAEVAALVAVIGALGSGGAPAPEPVSRTGWVNRAAQVRSLPAPGPGAWHAALR